MNQTMRYRAADNQELVEYLKRKGVIKSQRVFDVLSKVDRKNYVNNHNPYNDAYIDSPQNIGNGRTISAPHMHAVVLETLNSKLINGSKVLSIRCSAGYLTTCMALLVEPNGIVVHVESNSDIQFKVKVNLIKDIPSLLTHRKFNNNRQIQFILDDELNGYSPEAPYDVIYIGAAVSKVPQKIIDQLAVDGCLLVPLIKSKFDPDETQILTLVKKNAFSDEGITKEELISVKYSILNANPVINGQVKNNYTNKCFQNVLKTKNVENNSTSIPKILETPVSISPASVKNMSEINLKNNKLLDNSQKNESQLASDAQDFDMLKLQDKFDSLETRISELADTFRKSRKTSLCLKESNQSKLNALENKFFNLYSEINAMKNMLVQKGTEQCTSVENINKQLELKLYKLNKKIISKSTIMEKNSMILKRKLNKKIGKLKRIMEDKISDEGKLLMKELSVFKVSIEDKLAKENAVFYEKISRELERRYSHLESKMKTETFDSKDKENHGQNNQNVLFIFCAIITLHSVQAISKIIF